jgi:hypothetical protein
MAYPALRSCNDGLREGSTDSVYKKYAQDRGGFVELATAEVRRQMSGLWHGFNEISPKASPCGGMITTKYDTDITPEDMENV